MTLFIQLQDGQPVGRPIAEDNFRQLFPYTSFPTYFTADTVEPLGYGIYDFSNAPIAGHYEKIVEVSPVRNEYGIWQQAYAIVPMDNADKQNANEKEAFLARAERNHRLDASDWTQLADAPVDNLAWAIYRQALRDIPKQAGFPSTIVWPTKP
jgi:hypothetical protein